MSRLTQLLRELNKQVILFDLPEEVFSLCDNVAVFLNKSDTFMELVERMYTHSEERSLNDPVFLELKDFTGSINIEVRKFIRALMQIAFITDQMFTSWRYADRGETPRYHTLVHKQLEQDTIQMFADLDEVLGGTLDNFTYDGSSTFSELFREYNTLLLPPSRYPKYIDSLANVFGDVMRFCVYDLKFFLKIQEKKLNFALNLVSDNLKQHHISVDVELAKPATAQDFLLDLSSQVEVLYPRFDAGKFYSHKLNLALAKMVRDFGFDDSLDSSPLDYTNQAFALFEDERFINIDQESLKINQNKLDVINNAFKLIKPDSEVLNTVKNITARTIDGVMEQLKFEVELGFKGMVKLLVFIRNHTAMAVPIIFKCLNQASSQSEVIEFIDEQVEILVKKGIQYVCSGEVNIVELNMESEMGKSIRKALSKLTYTSPVPMDLKRKQLDVKRNKLNIGRLTGSEVYTLRPHGHASLL